MKYQVTTWHGESATFFYVVEGDAPEEEQPRIVGTFEGGQMESDLAHQCAEALNNGATMYFAGIERRAKSMLFHLKYRNGDVTQSIVSPDLGTRLLAKLCRRHPEMIVDHWVVNPRLTLHKIYHGDFLETLAPQLEEAAPMNHINAYRFGLSARIGFGWHGVWKGICVWLSAPSRNFPHGVANIWTVRYGKGTWGARIERGNRDELL